MDSSEEGNMENISPTIKIDISHSLGVNENISVGESCSLTKLTHLKHLFEGFRYILA